MSAKSTTRDLLLLLVLAAASVLLNGYHFGQQDGAIYVPAIKQHPDPALYPHDSAYFLAQTRWTLLDELVAFSVHLTRLPLDLCIFLWHLLAIFLVLLACQQLARRCFASPTTQWAAVATIAAARLLPVAGTQIHLTERYLHARDLATAALLFALVAVLDRRPRALAWLAAAAVLHPTMALYGAFHLAVQAYGAWKLPRPAFASLLPFAVGAPLGGMWLWELFGPVENQAWHEVLDTRTYLFPLHWPWYGWLGVLVVLVLLSWFARLAASPSFSGASSPAGRRVGPLVEHLSRRVELAGIAGVMGAIVVSTVPAFEPAIPAEPMRVLHLVFFLFVFLGGGLLGEYVLRNRPWRWLLFFVLLGVAAFLSNRLVYRASPLIEWPGRAPRNEWVQAFDWVRRNTPPSALFALDPRYLLRPGEDAHGFRAFAERSMLSDWVKDRAVAAIDPGLAYPWRQQMRDLGIVSLSAEGAHDRWPQFGPEDFRRLKRLYGVSWVLLERSPARAPAAADAAARGAPAASDPTATPARPVAGLPCPYANAAVLVCRIE
ncbi:MAG: hypothetical protein HY237_05145 [Acidobacteria bacterium]|nr:hypothetical protein [Acidobacteriota bacterium]